MAKDTGSKTDLPAAEDVIEGTPKVVKGLSKAKAQAKAKAAMPSDERARAQGGNSSRLAYVSIGLSFAVIAWLGVLEVQKLRAPDSDIDTGKPAWQIARETDKAAYDTELSAVRASLAEVHSDIANMLKRVAKLEAGLQTQANTQAAAAGQLQDDITELRGALDMARSDVSELSAQLEVMPSQPTQSSIWFDGLATASQFGQDLGFWKEGRGRLIAPDGGWSEADTRLMKTLGSAETASHQSLVNAARSLIDAADIQGSSDMTAPSWLSWAGDFVRLRKIETGPDEALTDVYNIITTGDLRMVRDALLQREGLEAAAFSAWLSRVNSRLEFDDAIRAKFSDAGAL